MPAIDTLVDPIPDLPFPLESFPPAVAEWLEATAIQARVPVAFVAFPFLAIAGAALGNQISIQVSPGWTERPALWVALVAPTGGGKTPAIAAARSPFVNLQARAAEQERSRVNPYERMSTVELLEQVRSTRQQVDAKLLARLAADLANPDLPPALAPKQNNPTWNSPLFTTTGRVEHLTRVLAGASGLCLLRDELASLLHTIDRGRAEDHQILLSLWSSEPIYPSSSNLDPVLEPVLAMVGGLQPRLFHRLRSAAQDGLLERFLLVHPEETRIPRNDPGIEAPDAEPVLDLIQTLRPVEKAIATLSEPAALTWHGWSGLNAAEINAAGPTLQGFYRKFPSHVARIALILHALWHPDSVETPLDEPTIRRAIALADYLRPHTRRAAAALGDRNPSISAVADLTQRILGVLRVDSGWVSRTELRERLGRPELSRFNRVTSSLIDNETIEVSRETAPGGRKPVTLYRLPPRHENSHEVRS